MHRNKCNISHDIAFAEFLKVNKMEIPSLCKKQSTFYHFNNRDESQIDYFIESESIVKTYITFQREFQNLSTHDPVMISIEVEIPETLKSTKITRKLRIKWNKIDKQHFQELVSLDIGVLNDVHNSDDLVTKLCDILVKSTVKAYPSKGTKGKRKKRGIGHLK